MLEECRNELLALLSSAPKRSLQETLRAWRGHKKAQVSASDDTLGVLQLSAIG
jgi:hypothetical protein